MTTRTKRSIAHFAAPFRLHGLDKVQPAGDYDIDEDEEMIEGLSWLAYQRVATFIHIPARNFDQRKTQLVAIDYTELETALKKDQETIICTSAGVTNHTKHHPIALQLASRSE